MAYLFTTRPQTVVFDKYTLSSQICIKYYLDLRRPITTVAAFNANHWLQNCHQHKWLQVAGSVFSNNQIIFW